MTGSGDGMEAIMLNSTIISWMTRWIIKLLKELVKRPSLVLDTVFELTVDNQVTMSAMQLDK